MKRIINLFILFFVFEIQSHEFNPAHLVITETNSEVFTYEATWMYPFKNIGKRAEVIFPDNCLSNSEIPYIQGKYLIEKVTLNCNESLKGNTLSIINLSVLTDALVTINFTNDTFEGLVNLQKSSIKVPIEQQYYPTSYLNLGVSHLFDGLDHILFIFGLLFCISGFVNIIALPQGTVEALIALTIVYLALEIGKSDLKIKTPWLMAFSFGLLHGLGFASALMDIGIANNNIFLSLLFFNIGIELAQIALIPIPLIIIYLSRKINHYKFVQVVASYSIGGMGFYWFIDRVIGMIL